MNLCMFQSIRMDNIFHKRDKPVHVFAAGNASPLASINLAGINLFLFGLLSGRPESHYGFCCFGFVVG